MTTSDRELNWLSARELAAAVRRRDVSPVEIVDSTLARIKAVNAGLGAYCTVSEQPARRSAKAAERALLKRDAVLGPLHGVPFSSKDMITTKGVRTTFGSRLFSTNTPDEDAPSVARLKRAGAILVGKTNTSEMGWIAVTDNSLFGPTRNPWNPARTPGGSSGGAAAAVAAGLAPIALGGDAGGSIRVPAALSGVFGFKPSFGRVPVHPFSASWSLSHVGPLSRTVADAALVLSVTAGPDPRDANSLPESGVRYGRLRGDLSGLRVGWSPDLGFVQVDPEIQAITRKAAIEFRSFGCRVSPATVGWDDPHDAWKTIFQGSAATRLQEFVRDRREEMDPGLAALVEEASDWSSTRYVQAWFDRLNFESRGGQLFEKFDLLVTPATPVAAFAVGQRSPKASPKDIIPDYRWLGLNYPFNLTGQPAASVPCGYTADGLPVGLQIVGRRFDDLTVLRAAACFEEARPWTQSRPTGIDH